MKLLHTSIMVHGSIMPNWATSGTGQHWPAQPLCWLKCSAAFPWAIYFLVSFICLFHATFLLHLPISLWILVQLEKEFAPAWKPIHFFISGHFFFHTKTKASYIFLKTYQLEGFLPHHCWPKPPTPKRDGYAETAHFLLSPTYQTISKWNSDKLWMRSSSVFSWHLGSIWA